MQYRNNKRNKKPALIICLFLSVMTIVSLLPLYFSDKMRFLPPALAAVFFVSFLLLLGKYIIYDYIYVLTEENLSPRFEIYKISGKRSVLVFSHIITEDDIIISKADIKASDDNKPHTDPPEKNGDTTENTSKKETVKGIKRGKKSRSSLKKERKTKVGAVNADFTTELFSKSVKYFSYLTTDDKRICIKVSVGDDFASILNGIIDAKKNRS